jgi:tRNA(Ile)-lysidine synthase
MLTKVRKTIAQHRMLEHGDRVLAAVSGGPDSVALLKALAIISIEYGFFLMAAHLNHGLRGGEADREETFVRTLCKEMGLEFTAKKISLSTLEKRRGRSMEDLCREERYAFLVQTAKDQQATKIALGHHLQDQAETVLMNFLRGSGAEGLRGMLPVREGMFIRPMLEVTRNEILAFLEKEGLTFMTDSSNFQDFYLRNRIRHNLIPLLRECYNPRVEETLARTANIMRLDDEYMELAVGSLLYKWGVFCGEDEKTVSIPDFLNLHEALQHRLIKALLTGISPPEKGISFRHVRAVTALAQSGKGCGFLDMPGGQTVRREYDSLVFSRKTGLEVSQRRLLHAAQWEESRFSYLVKIPGRVSIPEAGTAIDIQFTDKPPASRLSGDERIVYMDYEAMRPPLVIRSLKPGDRIQPLGMAGTKKLKAFFIDEKIPQRERNKIPILTDMQSILWVVGFRMSERVKIVPNTKKTLRLEIV